VVSVGRNGSPAAAGGSVVRWLGTIGVIPGGGGGTDTGRLDPVPVTQAGDDIGATGMPGEVGTGAGDTGKGCVAAGGGL
jgi:hypothetical protein